MDEPTQDAKLCDKAEAYLYEMLGKCGCGGTSQLSIDFIMGRGADLWSELKAQRKNAGRPEPKPT